MKQDVTWEPFYYANHLTQVFKNDRFSKEVIWVSACKQST